MTARIAIPKYGFLLAALSALALAACPRGSVQVGSSFTCYELPFVVDSPDQTWEIAERLCAIEAGHVASVKNAFQNAFLQNLTKELNSEYVWLGGYYADGVAGGYWLWSEPFRAIDYFNWAPHEPSLMDKTARIAMHVSTGQWYAKSNDTTLQWACRVLPL